MAEASSLPGDAELAALLPSLRELRRDLHRHPELGFEEHRTQQVLRAWLESFGYAPRDCAGTGLVADLRPGSAPTIALRADLDALPIEETTDLPHRSQNPGVAHKCGHDGHSAILAGVAAVLARGCQSLPPGNVRLLFQPAEEGVRGGGARRMIDEGAVDEVREVYGLHNWPDFPKGELRVTAGPSMAREFKLFAQLRGRGGHASQPQTTLDPVTAGAQLVLAWNSLAAREIGVAGGAVLSVTSFQAGTTNNVIPGHARLLGTLRVFDEALGERLVRRLREVAAGIAAATGVLVELTVEPGFPVLVNDAGCAEQVRDVARQVFGAGLVSSAGLPLAASEDFAHFTRAVPGAYFFLGAGVDGADTPGCHHPDYDFDDDLLEPGVRMFVRLAERRLAALQRG